jgi:hypothetical protein
MARLGTQLGFADLSGQVTGLGLVGFSASVISMVESEHLLAQGSSQSIRRDAARGRRVGPS